MTCQQPHSATVSACSSPTQGQPDAVSVIRVEVIGAADSLVEDGLHVRVLDSPTGIGDDGMQLRTGPQQRHLDPAEHLVGPISVVAHTAHGIRHHSTHGVIDKVAEDESDVLGLIHPSQHQRIRRDRKTHSHLGGGGALRFEESTQVGLGDHLDAFDGSRYRTGAQDRGEVVPSFVGRTRVDEAKDSVETVGEFVALGPQGSRHRRHRFELTSHGQYLGLIAQGHDPADRDSITADSDGGGQQDPVADVDSAPQGTVIGCLDHHSSNHLRHLRTGGRIGISIGIRTRLDMGDAEQLFGSGVAQGRDPSRAECQHPIIETTQDRTLVTCHLCQLLGTDSQGLATQPATQSQGRNDADGQGEDGDGAEDEEFAAQVGIEDRGMNAHGDFTDDGRVIGGGIDRDLRPHGLPQGAALMRHGLPTCQRFIRGGGDTLADVVPVRVGQSDAAVVGDDGEDDARGRPQVIGDLEQRSGDRFIGFPRRLRRGFGGALPDLGIDRQRPCRRQRLGLGDLGDRTAAHPREDACHQRQGHHDDRELTEQDSAGKGSSGTWHQPTLTTHERNAQKVPNRQNVFSAHKRAPPR